MAQLVPQPVTPTAAPNHYPNPLSFSAVSNQVPDQRPSPSHENDAVDECEKRILEGRRIAMEYATFRKTNCAMQSERLNKRASTIVRPRRARMRDRTCRLHYTSSTVSRVGN